MSEELSNYIREVIHVLRETGNDGDLVDHGVEILERMNNPTTSIDQYEQFVTVIFSLALRGRKRLLKEYLSQQDVDMLGGLSRVGAMLDTVSRERIKEITNGN